jgi:hypothetical protein
VFGYLAFSNVNMMVVEKKRMCWSFSCVAHKPNFRMSSFGVDEDPLFSAMVKVVVSKLKRMNSSNKSSRVM